MQRLMFLSRSSRRRGPSIESMMAAVVLGLVGFLLRRNRRLKAADLSGPAAGQQANDSSSPVLETAKALIPEPAAESSTADEPVAEPTGEQTSEPVDERISESVSEQGTTAEASDGTSGEDSSPFRVHTERLTVDSELGTGAIDGAWWPVSQEATEAVPPLVDELPDDLGRVTRVTLAMPDWSEEQPKSVETAHGHVHLAWFAGMQRHTARITFENDESLVVLVLPTDTDPDTASTVLGLAAEDRSRSDLLSEAGVED